MANKKADQIARIIQEEVKRVGKIKDMGKIGVEIDPDPPKVLSTGFKELDEFIGGGLPVGQMIELAGEESAGKTTLALQIVKEVQENKGTCIYVDLERHFDSDYAKSLGVDTTKLVVVKPDKAELLFSVLVQLCKQGAADFIVIDSISSISTIREGDGFEKADVASAPNLISRLLRVLTPYMNNNSVTILTISQVRVNLTPMGAFGKKTPGGHSLHHKFVLGLWLRRKEKTIPATVTITINKSKRKGAIEGSKLDMRLSSNGFVNTRWLEELTSLDGVKHTKNIIYIDKHKYQKIDILQLGKKKVLGELKENGLPGVIELLNNMNEEKKEKNATELEIN